MKVSELVRLLQEQDQDATVGVSLTRRCGWVSHVAAVKRADDGTVCVDQAEETVHGDEVRIS